MKIDHILQLLISLALIYFLFSTLTSVIFEWYSFKTQKRGRFLHDAVHKLLNDPLNQSFGASLYAHYTINSLKKDRHSYPQYISSAMFADALIDTIGQQAEEVKFDVSFKDNGLELDKVRMVEKRNDDPHQRFAEGVARMKYSPFKSQLRAFHERSASYAELKTNISTWFDDYMQRVSGWYKTGTRGTLFFIGLLVALLFNLDSVQLVTTLNKDDELRKNLMLAAENISHNKKVPADSLPAGGAYSAYTAMAASLVKDSVDKNYLLRMDSVMTEVEDLSIPVGYHSNFKNQIKKACGLYWLAGILFSALALSFGAPFWFDVLIKVTNIRRAGIKPQEQTNTNNGG